MGPGYRDPGQWKEGTGGGPRYPGGAVSKTAGRRERSGEEEDDPIPRTGPTTAQVLLAPGRPRVSSGGHGGVVFQIWMGVVTRL
jgi:hypothetical protein